MEAKWPFMLITLGLLFALGFTIANLERSTVMNDWENRRCDLPIMTAAFFFKPDTDTRTGGPIPGLGRIPSVEHRQLPGGQSRKRPCGQRVGDLRNVGEHQ
jgi:hypothetical protein